MAGILSSSPFQNSKPHPQIRSETPGITRRSLEVVPTPVSNYFRSVHRQRNPRIPLCLSRRELRPGSFDSSIRLTIHPQSTILCSAPVRVVFSDEAPPLLYLGFLCFLCFSVCTGPPSPSPHLPRRRLPSPSRVPPPSALLREHFAWSCGRRPNSAPYAAPSSPPFMVERKKKR
jgi:hypothetical protein